MCGSSGYLSESIEARVEKQFQCGACVEVGSIYLIQLETLVKRIDVSQS